MNYKDSLMCSLKPMALIAALLFSSTSFCHAQSNDVDPKNITVRPATLSYNLTSDQSATKKITVNNQTDKSIQFTVYLADWMRDSIGGHTYYKPDSLPISCAKWITFDKTFLEVGAKQTGEINVKVHVPADPAAVNAMKWAMVFVESIDEKVTPENKKGLTSIINNKMRIGVHVYQTPPSLSKKEVQLLRFSSVRDSVNQFKVVCKNTGDIQLECKTYMELSSLKDGKKTTVDGRVFPTFPGQERMVIFKLPETMPKGKYNAVAAVDAGDDVPLEAAQAVIEVK